MLGSGDNNNCKSGRCEKISATDALCAPKNGFKEGTKCNEDTDCDKSKSLWCKGGSFYESGTCKQCPANCPDGCNSLFNLKDNMKCGRMTTFDHAADLAKKLGKPIVDFVNCLLPETLVGCAADAAGGAVECLNPATPCKLKLGGKGSKCLALKDAGLSYNYKSGPLTISGSVTPTGGMAVEADITNGKSSVQLFGKVAVKADITIKASASGSVPLTKKKLYLTDCKGKICNICKNPTSKLSCRPKLLYRKMFKAGYVPIIVEVKVQAVALKQVMYLSLWKLKCKQWL